MKKWLAILFFVGFQCLAQNKSSDAAQTMPSKEEFSELLSKADQQVSAFERTVKTVTPSSDGPISDLATKGLEAASAAHTIISAQQRNGPTGYGLVTLVVTLDDLNSNAIRSALVLVSTDRDKIAAGGRPDPNLPSFVLALSTAGSSCNDIAELIMHATLRYLSVEETILGELLDGKK
jgi:hypothetical protein